MYVYKYIFISLYFHFNLFKIIFFSYVSSLKKKKNWIKDEESFLYSPVNGWPNLDSWVEIRLLLYTLNSHTELKKWQNRWLSLYRIREASSLRGLHIHPVYKQPTLLENVIGITRSPWKDKITILWCVPQGSHISPVTFTFTIPIHDN